MCIRDSINTHKPWTKKGFQYIIHQNIRDLFGKKDLLENFMTEKLLKLLDYQRFY